MSEREPLAALIGIDWADQHHDVALQDTSTAVVERLRLPHSPEAIGEWLATLAALRQGHVGIAVETRGPWSTRCSARVRGALPGQSAEPLTLSRDLCAEWCQG
jgi:hypothetical protein